MKKFLFALPLMLALSAPALSRPGGPGKHLKHILEQLDLDESQKTKMTEIRQNSRAAMRAQRQEMKAQRRAFQELLKSNASDEDLRKAFASLENLKAKLSQFRFENMLQIRKVLTAEQRSRFHELKELHRPKKSGHEFQGNNP
ncbi:MAG: Spy/CpxP family protein refolding chaperone [Pseudobacteriovorax sp.]|nr:Spy/CpxP family protein refolding chaperone [Pseudobacteriovorax sp.]